MMHFRLGAAAKISLVLFGLLMLAPLPRAEAQVMHQLIRRLVVFPVKTDQGLEAAGEDAWWQAREQFTESRRFLVASKQFLVKSDVYQPRTELEPADSIILGRLLDAHGLITYQQVGRKLTMRVYDGSNGLTLWEKTLNLHPSLTINDQLPQLARKMANDFIAGIPYQGYTIIDPAIGQAVYEEGDISLAQIDLGTTTGAQIGDVVQWVEIANLNQTPLFQGGGKSTIYAEGKVVRVEQGVATVEILRANSLKNIKEFTLVRLPREADRLLSEFQLLERPRTTLTAELASPEAGPMEKIARERRPLMTTLSWVGSVAAFLLLAF